mmetsp:Transcript_13079/g.17102  ORF Transcript_13079/g.17102 Transcript_13079/m.17102 type:complete len:116 (-) Transcript_13079:875-1222(-)
MHMELLHCFLPKKMDIQNAHAWGRTQISQTIPQKKPGSSKPFKTAALITPFAFEIASLLTSPEFFCGVRSGSFTIANSETSLSPISSVNSERSSLSDGALNPTEYVQQSLSRLTP